jgi:hypothetical protein
MNKKEWWACSICGPATNSRANWCNAGCGRDYNEMTKLVLPQELISTIREKVLVEIEKLEIVRDSDRFIQEEIIHIFRKALTEIEGEAK